MKSWIKIVSLFTLFYLSTIVSARPGYGRFTNENQIGAHDAVLNFARTGEDDLAGKMNEELLGVVNERQKRLSDQRRAELETLMALYKMTGKLHPTVMRSGRQLDISKIGRRKRSVFDMNMKNLRKLFRLSGQLGYKGNAAYPVVS
ncbi:uncharacterized protein LOC128888647 [Hylaeus anthracinus]|uniref:uncharacterized protein LOC128888647 n=1 Tax=Hylaeus anthracinus TaxID=313031 RepID=UPI0023B8B69B|nr:uncharacterized protein LOC128888647 [Hylaeus anthracinus]